MGPKAGASLFAGNEEEIRARCEHQSCDSGDASTNRSTRTSMTGILKAEHGSGAPVRREGSSGQGEQLLGYLEVSGESHLTRAEDHAGP